MFRLSFNTECCRKYKTSKDKLRASKTLKCLSYFNIKTKQTKQNKQPSGKSKYLHTCCKVEENDITASVKYSLMSV